VRLLVIGGSDAGISAGLAAKELDPTADVTLLVADAYPNFSICGIPYHVSGDVPDWRNLAHRTSADLEKAGLTLRLGHRATTIDPDRHTVTTTSADGGATLEYDRLMIGTGAVPARPPIDGLDRLGPDDGVHVLHTMGDTFALLQSLDARNAQSAVIVGAGYIGLEMAEALTTRGLHVTVVEQLNQVMPTIDPELAAPLAEHLTMHGVTVRHGTAVTAIDTDGGWATRRHRQRHPAWRRRPRRHRRQTRHRPRRQSRSRPRGPRSDRRRPADAHRPARHLRRR
jgi:NADPH-dependent 2,4-dienoyl-CoA reductase/sulfur reductase-like enzyme